MESGAAATQAKNRIDRTAHAAAMEANIIASTRRSIAKRKFFYLPIERDRRGA
jgi:hypothetical protein